MRKIGILEDDETLGKELAYYLESNDYEVKLITPRDYEGKSKADLVEFLMEGAFHMLLLDIELPGVNGLHICKEFRARSETPVIMITSKNDDMTELTAIHNGADDFVAKPFHPQILIAHMESVLRRVYKNAVPSDEMHIVQELEIDGGKRHQEFTLELQKGRAICENKVKELSKNELQILKILAIHQGNIVSRDDIMNALWDNCMFVDDNTLTVNMTRLKGKLEEIGIKQGIVTKRGMGYQLV